MPSEALTFVFEPTDSAVRVAKIDSNGVPWFVARDVCNVLGYASPDVALRKLPARTKEPYSVRTLGGPQQMVIVNEAGLYRLILKSRKPEAEAFTDWVTEEVLPSIRKTGRYSRQAKRAEELERWKGEPSVLIHPDEVAQLRSRARVVAQNEGLKGLGEVWRNFRKLHYLPTGKAFAPILKIEFAKYLEELTQRASATPEAPARTPSRGQIISHPKGLPPVSEHRPADPEMDFNASEVAKRLGRDLVGIGFDGLRIPQEALDGRDGLYEISGLDVLRDKSMPKAAYLDGTRYKYLVHWMRTNVDWAISILVRKQSPRV